MPLEPQGELAVLEARALHLLPEAADGAGVGRRDAEMAGVDPGVQVRAALPFAPTAGVMCCVEA
jgi:hypothetical protein